MKLPPKKEDGNSLWARSIAVFSRLSLAIEALAGGKQSEEWKFDIRDANGKLTKTITAERQEKKKD